jgi:hypothetical protein
MVVMRTSLELPDLLCACLKARASTESLTLKHLWVSYVERGLNATPSGSGPKRSAHTLPLLGGPLVIEGEHLSNAALFDLLEA